MPVRKGFKKMVWGLSQRGSKHLSSSFPLLPAGKLPSWLLGDTLLTVSGVALNSLRG